MWQSGKPLYRGCSLFNVIIGNSQFYSKSCGAITEKYARRLFLKAIYMNAGKNILPIHLMLYDSYLYSSISKRLYRAGIRARIRYEHINIADRAHLHEACSSYL